MVDQFKQSGAQLLNSAERMTDHRITKFLIAFVLLVLLPTVSWFAVDKLNSINNELLDIKLNARDNINYLRKQMHETFTVLNNHLIADAKETQRLQYLEKNVDNLAQVVQSLETKNGR